MAVVKPSSVRKDRRPGDRWPAREVSSLFRHPLRPWGQGPGGLRRSSFPFVLSRAWQPPHFATTLVGRRCFCKSIPARIGSGYSLLFMSGHPENGSWSRPKRTGPTDVFRFMDDRKGRAVSAFDTSQFFCGKGYHLRDSAAAVRIVHSSECQLRRSARSLLSPDSHGVDYQCFPSTLEMVFGMPQHVDDDIQVCLKRTIVAPRSDNWDSIRRRLSSRSPMSSLRLESFPLNPIRHGAILRFSPVRARCAAPGPFVPPWRWRCVAARHVSDNRRRVFLRRRRVRSSSGAGSIRRWDSKLTVIRGTSRMTLSPSISAEAPVFPLFHKHERGDHFGPSLRSAQEIPKVPVLPEYSPHFRR